MAWCLDKLFDTGAEVRGVERVPESERKQSGGWEQMVFWFSVNLSFSALASGMLGTEYYTLDFKTSVTIILVMSAFGCATTAWITTLGPKYGLRTMALARFAGGFPGTFIFSILNLLTQIAYSVTTALAGAQALHAINGEISLTVGIVIVSVIVLVLTVYGLKVVQLWENWAWIVCLIIYFIVMGLGARGGYDVNKGSATQDTGAPLIGDVLSYAGIYYSISSGWTTIGCDYNVNLPAKTPPMRSAAMTFIGVYVPITATAIMSTAMLTITNPDYMAAFEEDSLGGLVGKILEPAGGFGKFLLVVLMFSAISANIPNTYSGALCFQTLHPIFMKVPRVIYVMIFTAIYLAVAIVGQEHFGEILSNFASLLSYWTAFFTVIMMLEFLWFRRKNGPLGEINPDIFNDFSKLPPGYACVASILIAIGGCVPSMAETWYTGPIALLVSQPYGGDLGFEFSAVFTFVSYLALRTLEIKYFGR
ncbi:cytosine-purine permease [Xylariales sp. PMI_506]|nr:cytosine-purine permease [Xylariales sp. PMI_506]